MFATRGFLTFLVSSEILASVPWVPLQPGKGKLKIDEAKLWSEYFDVSCKLFRIFPRCCEKELIVFVLRLSLTWFSLTAPDIRDMQKTVISSHCLSHHHETSRNPPEPLRVMLWPSLGQTLSTNSLGLAGSVMWREEAGRWPDSSEWFKYRESSSFN